MPDYLNLYQRHVLRLMKTGSDGEWVGRCPFPKCNSSQSPKFYVNADSGQFHCKRCGAGGNAITFAREFGEDPTQYYDVNTSPNEPPEDINRLSRNLSEHPAAMPPYWEAEVIDALKVGWDIHGEHLVFPVFDAEDQLVNVIRHKRRQWRGARVCLYPANFISRYDPFYIIIMEGLKDVVSGLSFKLQCATSTGGAASLPRDISILGRFERIYLCQDNDEAGEQGTERWIDRLRNEFSRVKLRVCDLSDFIGDGEDITDYLSLPGKDRQSFQSEVLDRARVGMPFSDVPDFVRQTMLSDKFRALNPRDRLLYQELMLRAPRHHVLTTEINGMRVRMRPGEYITTLTLLLGLCPPYKEKQIRTSLARLIEAGFIKQRDLKCKRGRIITLVGWGNGEWQRERQSEADNSGKAKFPFPPSIFQSIPQDIGQTDSRDLGTGNGQHKEYLTLGGEGLHLEIDQELSKRGIENKPYKSPSSRIIKGGTIHQWQLNRCCDCRHMIPNRQNPKQGWAQCGIEGAATWPMKPHTCPLFEASQNQEALEA